MAEDLYPPAVEAGYEIMSHVVQILNDREFCDQPILPNADTLTAWYDSVIGPAIDKIERDIKEFPEDYGLTDDDFTDN